MLTITIPSLEQWDEGKQEFIYTKGKTLQLEHSLVSLSKWESKWCKPFLTKEEKTFEETIDYIRCMTMTPNVDPETYNSITNHNLEQVNQYIDAPMTATTISNKTSSPNREIITSELVYYWMITLNIPFECQKWHLNRLLMLVQVCNAKNAPKQMMNKKDLMSRNAELNAARRKQLNTKG